MWSFENSFTDSTNVYNTKPISQNPSFVTGYVGQAASFNASSKQALYTSFISLNNVDFTVDLWVKQNGYPNPQEYSIVGLCPTHVTSYCLHLTIRNKKLYMGFFYNDLQSTTTVTLNRWTHVAFVFERNSLRQSIYVNGVLDQQRIATNPLKCTRGNVTIGTNEYVLIPNNYFQV